MYFLSFFLTPVVIFVCELAHTHIEAIRRLLISLLNLYRILQQKIKLRVSLTAFCDCVNRYSNLSPLMGTLKPQSNGPLYSNTVIGTLAVDGRAVTFVQRGGTRVGCGPAQSPFRCTKCNSPPINDQCTDTVSGVARSLSRGGHGQGGQGQGSRRACSRNQTEVTQICT